MTVVSEIMSNSVTPVFKGDTPVVAHTGQIDHDTSPVCNADDGSGAGWGVSVTIWGSVTFAASNVSNLYQTGLPCSPLTR